jgi:hypothetical protein
VRGNKPISKPSKKQPRKAAMSAANDERDKTYNI